MNATKQGLQAGQSTRIALNKATNTAVEGGKTVATAVSGFIKGFLAPTEAYEAPKAKRAAPKAKPTSPRKAK